MEKKQKIIIAIVTILLIILIIFGIFSFISYKPSEKEVGKPNTDFGTSEEASNPDEENVDWSGSTVVYYSSKEEVIKAINKEWTMGNTTASFESEDEDCWYFVDTNYNRYAYCKSDSIIKIVEPTSE